MAPRSSSGLSLAIILIAYGLGLPDVSFGADPVLPGLAEQVALVLRYDDDSRRKLLAGETVSHQLKDEEKKELALTVATKVPLSSKAVFAELEAKTFLEIDRTIHAWGLIDEPTATAASFKQLVLPDAELDSLLKVSAGDRFNLSREEIALLGDVSKSLRGQSKTERRAGIMQAYRELLALRVEAYRARNIAGIAPYARKRNRSEPAKDLADSLPPSTSLIANEAPDFYRQLSLHPIEETTRVDLEGIESQVIWLLQGLHNRPAVVLAHRVIGLDHRNSYLAQRDFYISHTADALQILAGCLPLGPDESVVFYANRTYTEQVAGFASGAAHGIGRKVLEKEVRSLFKSVLTSLKEKGSGS